MKHKNQALCRLFFK